MACLEWIENGHPEGEYLRHQAHDPGQDLGEAVLRLLTDVPLFGHVGETVDAHICKRCGVVYVEVE